MAIPSITGTGFCLVGKRTIAEYTMHGNLQYSMVLCEVKKMATYIQHLEKMLTMFFQFVYYIVLV